MHASVFYATSVQPGTRLHARHHRIYKHELTLIKRMWYNTTASMLLETDCPKRDCPLKKSNLFLTGAR